LKKKKMFVRVGGGERRERLIRESKNKKAIEDIKRKKEGLPREGGEGLWGGRAILWKKSPSRRQKNAVSEPTVESHTEGKKMGAKKGGRSVSRKGARQGKRNFQTTNPQEGRKQEGGRGSLNVGPKKKKGCRWRGRRGEICQGKEGVPKRGPKSGKARAAL